MMYDYLFYLVYKFYSAKEKGALWSSSAIVGGLQAMNLLTVYMVLSAYFPELSINKVIFLVVVVLFLIIADIRYVFTKKNVIERMETKWEGLTDAQKTRIRSFSLAYIVLSVCVFFGIAIYIGSQ